MYSLGSTSGPTALLRISSQRSASADPKDWMIRGVVNVTVVLVSSQVLNTGFGEEIFYEPVFFIGQMKRKPISFPSALSAHGRFLPGKTGVFSSGVDDHKYAFTPIFLVREFMGCSWISRRMGIMLG